jgi:hypothetical protein
MSEGVDDEEGVILTARVKVLERVAVQRIKGAGRCRLIYTGLPTYNVGVFVFFAPVRTEKVAMLYREMSLSAGLTRQCGGSLYPVVDRVKGGMQE